MWINLPVDGQADIVRCPTNVSNPSTTNNITSATNQWKRYLPGQKGIDHLQLTTMVTLVDFGTPLSGASSVGSIPSSWYPEYGNKSRVSAIGISK
jgi:hypothetical protein